jgi:hypothetical protein
MMMTMASSAAAAPRLWDQLWRFLAVLALAFLGRQSPWELRRLLAGQVRKAVDG